MSNENKKTEKIIPVKKEERKSPPPEKQANDGQKFEKTVKK